MTDFSYQGGSWGSPPRPVGPGAAVIALAMVITALLLTAGVTAAFKSTSPSHGSGSHRLATPAPTTTGPGSSSTAPSSTVAPTTTTPPTTTRPGAVAPVSPLSVPPLSVPPVASKPSSLPSAVIASIVNPGVVDVDTRLAYQHAIAAGTGMVLTSNGVILTNNHVIDGATTIGAVSVGSNRSYPAHVLGVDPSADVAVIQLDGASGLPVITTSSLSVVPGDPVVAIGNAGGVGGPPTVTTGTVLATNQSIVASDPAAGTSEQLDGLIETSATLQPGDSGGPLVNGSGQIIGMNTAASVATGSTTASFAIPISQALAIARQIQAGQAGNGVYLGLPPFLGVQATTGSLAGRSGAAVTAVVAGGPAAAVGITPGALIIAINGQVVDAPTALSSVLRQFRPGDAVTVTWLDRTGASHSARLVLGTGPAD